MRVIFSNGSVIAGMLVKIDMQAQVNQQGLFSVMNDTLSRGALGKYQVDPSSIRLQGTVQFSSVHSIVLCWYVEWCTTPARSLFCLYCGSQGLKVGYFGVEPWIPKPLASGICTQQCEKLLSFLSKFKSVQSQISCCNLELN